MKKASLRYLHNNYAVVMCDNNKRAIQSWSENNYYKPYFEDVWFNHKNGGQTALLCGERSDRIEILDFDLNNIHDPIQFMDDFYTLVVKHLSQEFLNRMVIQQTPSGGYHLIYKIFSSNVDKREIICRAKNMKIIVEAMGEGTYFIVAPSTNYKLIQGSFETIPVITLEEKSPLWLCVKSLDQLYN